MSQREQDITEARRRISDLSDRIESYAGGDRPMSPPVALLRELYAAEDRLRELQRSERPIGRSVLAEVGSTIKVGGIDGLADGTYAVVRVWTAHGFSRVELRKAE